MSGTWSFESIGKYAEIKHGFAFKGQFFADEPSKFVVVTPGNFAIGGGFKNSKLKWYDPNGPLPNEYLLAAGDLIVTMTDLSRTIDTLGYPAIVPRTEHIFLHNQRIGLVNVTDPSSLDQHYLYWVMRTDKYRRQVIASASGTTVHHTSPSRIRDVKIPIPPLPIQRRIAEILGRLDDKIEVNRRINRTLEQMAQALYKHWFVDFGPFQDGAFVESEVGLIPAGWGVGRLGDIAEINAASVRKGNEPERIKYVDISSVSTGQINEMKAMRFADAPSRARRLVSHGDVIWSAVRPNRRTFALIQYPDPELVVSTGFVVVSPVQVPYSFLYTYLSTPEFTDYLVARATGAAYPAVRGSDFEGALIVIPEESVLAQFDKVVRPWFEDQHALSLESEKLAVTRDYLLPKLLSGAVDVSGPILDEDEFAGQGELAG